MVYEYDKKHLRERYHGNKAAMRKAGDCAIWTPERISILIHFSQTKKIIAGDVTISHTPKTTK